VGELVADGTSQALSVSLAEGRATLRFNAGSPPPAAGELVTLSSGSLSPHGHLVPGQGLFRWSGDSRRHDYVTALPARLEIVVDDPDLEVVELRFLPALKTPLEKVRSAYLAEVAYVDRAIGELREALEHSGWMENALVILTSDHGEGLGDHDLRGHIHQLYDSLLRVPLILWAPGLVPAGEVDSSPVGLVDVLPTVLALTGTTLPTGVRGRDLLDSHTRAAGYPPLLAQTFAPEANADLEAVVFEGYKLIRRAGADEGEVYRLTEDAAELHDIASVDTKRLRLLSARLEALLAEVAVGTTRDAVLDDEERQQLRALGYEH
jgi:arylsulfatase A-like enzyme